MPAISPAEYVVLGLFVFVAYRFLKPIIEGFNEGATGEEAGKFICPSCGSRGHSETVTRGSVAIEIILWLCFVIPGLIYSIWRITTRYPICAQCKLPGVIPANSPNGAAIVTKFASRATVTNDDRAPCPQCKELIIRGARVCRFCGVKFEA